MGQIIVTSKDKESLDKFREARFPELKLMKHGSREGEWCIYVPTSHKESIEMPLDHAIAYIQTMDKGVMKQYNKDGKYIYTPPFSSQAQIHEFKTDPVYDIEQVNASRLYDDNHPYMHQMQNTQSLETNKMVSGNKILKGE